MGGQDYNLTTSGGLLSFAQGALKVPFVKRISSSSQPFQLQSHMLSDNAIAVASTILTAGIPSTLATVQPPSGSQQAFYVESAGTLAFSSKVLLTSSKIVASGFTKVASSSLPWPVETFFTIANMPSFSTLSTKCLLVSVLFIELDVLVVDLLNYLKQKARRVWSGRSSRFARDDFVRIAYPTFSELVCLWRICEFFTLLMPTCFIYLASSIGCHSCEILHRNSGGGLFNVCLKNADDVKQFDTVDRELRR